MTKYVRSEISKDVLSELKKISSTTAWSVLATITGDPFFRDSHRMMNVRPIDPSYRVCGQALTVRWMAYDPLNMTPEEKALRNSCLSFFEETYEAVNPGDVVVHAALGRRDAGIGGDGIALGFKAKGAEGYIIDGSLRDIPFIRKLGLPTFTLGGTGTNTTALYHIHEGKPAGLLPVEHNVSVLCDGVWVKPGDIIIGDEDGVIVIPLEYAEEVARVGGAQEDLEVLERKLILKGEFNHGQPWTYELAKAHGVLAQWTILKDTPFGVRFFD